MGDARLLMVIPTYNEADNLAGVVARLHASVPEAHVLVVDDDSPDGTGELADRLAGADPRIRVLHRRVKEGLGAAYIAGFRIALEQGYDVIGEMDADGSHQPEQLPRLLAELDRGADLVIGSRWVSGGSVLNWAWHRRALSVGGNLYTRLLLGMEVRDATAGFRLFRASMLRRIDLDGVQSVGYVFQVDLAYRTIRAGGRVVEVPIEFVERVRGESKMTVDVARESLFRITRWGLAERIARHRGGAGRPDAG